MRPEKIKFQSTASCLQVNIYTCEKPQLKKNIVEKAHLQLVLDWTLTSVLQEISVLQELFKCIADVTKCPHRNN